MLELPPSLQVSQIPTTFKLGPWGKTETAWWEVEDRALIAMTKSHPSPEQHQTDREAFPLGLSLPPGRKRLQRTPEPMGSRWSMKQCGNPLIPKKILESLAQAVL